MIIILFFVCSLSLCLSNLSKLLQNSLFLELKEPLASRYQFNKNFLRL